MDLPFDVSISIMISNESNYKILIKIYIYIITTLYKFHGFFRYDESDICLYSTSIST